LNFTNLVAILYTVYTSFQEVTKIIN
jgi:hypothetical protein